MQHLLPSPTQSSFSFGPVTIYFYALCILAGIATAIWLGRRRYASLGGNSDDVSEVAIWAVPFGIIGGRIYHVVTSPEQYFGANGDPTSALRIWEGGLGIWGAISFGVLGAYLYFKTHKTSLNFAQLLDCLAPGVVLAQAIGRLGNYFNQELFGRPTTLPWGLEIDPLKRPAGYEAFETFHPTFLYELIWCVSVAYLLIKMPGILKKFVSRNGDIFALYVLGYTLGRLWIEALRIDEANLILGLRLNIWVSLLVIIASFSYLARSKGRGNTKEKEVAS